MLAEIDAFRATLAEHFITFDPGDMDEKRLLFEAGAATQRGQTSFTLKVNGCELSFNVAEVSSVARDIDGQIYARDFKLIDQSDMIVSFIPRAARRQARALVRRRARAAARLRGHQGGVRRLATRRGTVAVRDRDRDAHLPHRPRSTDLLPAEGLPDQLPAAAVSARPPGHGVMADARTTAKSQLSVRQELHRL